MKLVPICAFCGSREIKKINGGLCYCYNCRRERHIASHFVDSNIIDKIITKIHKLEDKACGL